MNNSISAVVLAAGQSRRMGRPKLVLPWGTGTVIGQVVQTLQSGGAAEIIVVTGAAGDLVAQALAGLQVRLVVNPDFAASEMLQSLQIGISAISPHASALLVTPGDHPALEPAAVQAVVEVFQREGALLVIPSFQHRRGHPWLVARLLWPELLALAPGQTLRDFLNAHAADIRYVPVDLPGVLQDLDTPEDYAAQKPG